MQIRDVSLNEFNAIANSDDVLPHINPFVDRVDLADAWKGQGVLAKGCEGVSGAVLMIPRINGAYEVHWFMPGNAGMQAIEAIITWLFERENATAAYGWCPKNNLPARLVNRWLGAKVVGEFVDEYGRPCVTMAASRDDWYARCEKRRNLTKSSDPV